MKIHTNWIDRHELFRIIEMVPLELALAVEPTQWIRDQGYRCKVEILGNMWMTLDFEDDSEALHFKLVWC